MNTREKYVRLCGMLVLLLLLGALFGPWHTARAQDTSFTYRALIELGEEFRFELPIAGDTRGKVIYARHVEATVEYCATDSPFVCVWTAWYSFAVPKDLSIKNQREWVVNGYTFERIGKRQAIELLGKVIDDVYTILTPQEASSNGRTEGKPTISLYSPTVGLIGFRDVRSDEFYCLTAAYGFGRIQETP